MSPCAFCRIAAAHPPVPPSTYLHQSHTESKPHLDITEDGHAFLVLSTEHVLAFLDIMPLTRGHVLVVPRKHSEKISEIGVKMGRELGTWLPILSRVVMRTVFGESDTEPDPHSDTIVHKPGEALNDEAWNWNVVQNNGHGAAQVVPHVHFHIVPRPPLGAASTSAKMSFIMFGRGQREDLDDEEAEELAGELRRGVAKEVARVREAEGIDLEEGMGVGERGSDGKGGSGGGKGRL
ncbi:HIT-like domain-containing protein [Aspergillus karnatakaensis]|uniref:HIT-like domain-containing protein n=1 Tax=Aspergillus karnatakaensis TaxID=1810916 RepID=UPI003CCDDB2B